MGPKVSIIVPIYNGERFLNQTVDSIIHQTHDNIEVLLINDGSTDNSGSICKQLALKDDRIHVKMRAKSGGVSNARNEGIEMATGEYVFFCDHDDFLFPDMIETCIKNIGNRDLLVTGFLKAPEKTFSQNMPRELSTEPTFVADNFSQLTGKNYDNIVKWIGGIWRCLFRMSILKEHHIQFRNIKYEDEIFLAEYNLNITSAIRIDNYQGYCWIDRNYSQGSSHKYIAEKDWIELRKDLYRQTEAKYYCNIGWAYIDIINRYTHYILKGYYNDTKKERSERIKRWKEFREDSWRTYFNHVQLKGTLKFTWLVAKFRLYHIVDILLLTILKIKKI